jgi:hypothetical protein
VSVPPDVTGQDFTATLTPAIGKPAIVFVHGWNGLKVLSCDWVKPDPYFKSVDNVLSTTYYVTYAYLESSWCHTPSIKENVWRLQNAIALAKAATGQSKVILIAHSMGGIVSRAYIENKNIYQHDVSALFTFGSPHLGLPPDEITFLADRLSLGTYCKDIQPAVCDFSVKGMQLFNSTHQKPDDVNYHLISGNALFFTLNPLGQILSILSVEPDDGIIPTSSGLGLGLSGTIDRFQTDEVHGDILGWGQHDYFDIYTSWTQCLKPVLIDKTKTNCGNGNILGPTTVVTPTLSARTPFEFGALPAGQTVTRTISLGSGAALFAAQWQTGTLTMTLTAPNGQLIDPAFAVSNPITVSYQSNATSAAYYFTSTVPGAWQLVLQGGNAPVSGTAYSTFAAFDSAVMFTSATNKNWYAPGVTAIITASLSGSPASAVVTATILRADGVTDTISLSSLGAGQYQGMYVVPNAPGYTEIRLVATGATASSTPFERGNNLVFQISPNSATLNGIYSSTPQPRLAGLSLYQALTVTVGINSAISGTIGLSADLLDGNGNFVAHSSAIEAVITGTVTLSLRFDGDDIFASQRNGPYTLTNVLLTDETGVILVTQEAEAVYSTAPYLYTDFASPIHIFLPVILK